MAQPSEAAPSSLPETMSQGGLPQSQFPWAQIPRYEAGTTDLNDYRQKMEFLHAIWPKEHRQHLAPRAVLM